MRLGASTLPNFGEAEVIVSEEDDNLIAARTSNGLDGSSHFQFRKHSRTIRTCICFVGFITLLYISGSVRQLLLEMRAEFEIHLQFEQFERNRSNETKILFENLLQRTATSHAKLESLMGAQDAKQQAPQANEGLNSRLDTLSKNLKLLQIPSPEPDKVVQQQMREVAQHIKNIEKSLPDLQGRSDQIKKGMEPIRDTLANIRKSLLESQSSAQFHVNYGASISLNMAMVQICGIKDILEALKSRDAWFKLILHKLDKRDPEDSPLWTRFDFFGPAYSLCPAGKLNSFGSGYGETEACDLQRLSELNGECKILSIGSSSDSTWSFEKAVFERTNCEVHTFDCDSSSSPPPEITSRVFAYHKCLGVGHSSVALPADYLPYHVILSMIGSRRGPTYLKMHAKGFEWNILPDILSNPSNLPEQIHLELQYHNRSGSLGWQFSQKSSAEIALFGEMLFRAGFLPFSRRDNMLDSRGESVHFLLGRIAQ